MGLESFSVNEHMVQAQACSSMEGGLSPPTLEMWKEIWAWMKETDSFGFLRGAASLQFRSLDFETKSSRIEGT